MTSKNGSPELISLLQYMKKTTLENPEVVIRDERMTKLDSLVNEIKESEEWEAVSMSIYSVALEAGLADGRKEGLKEGLKEGRKEGLALGRIGLICKKLQKGKSIETIADELEENVDAIYPIFEFAKNFAPEYDPDKVLDAWLKQNNFNNSNP